MDKRFVILLGTKGQMTKMFPVMQEFDRRKIEYTYVQSNQHPHFNQEHSKQFGLKEPDLFLWESEEDLKSIKETIKWFWHCLCVAYRNRKLFQGKILITHGDTLSTLLAIIIGKLYKCKIAHIESGYRSYSFLNPFPEEIIRCIACRFSDYLFAHSWWAYKNLRKYKGIKINTGIGTIYDSLKQITTIGTWLNEVKNYIVATSHRQETLYNYSKFKKILKTILQARSIAPVIYILHSLTVQKLHKYDYYEKLSYSPEIAMIPIQNYSEFINLIANSLFVITDGGSIQEETYYLNKPCLLMRDRTEKMIGLSETACLSKFDDIRINHFLNNWQDFKRIRKLPQKEPSKIIVDFLENAEDKL